MLFSRYLKNNFESRFLYWTDNCKKAYAKKRNNRTSVGPKAMSNIRLVFSDREIKFCMP